VIHKPDPTCTPALRADLVRDLPATAKRVLIIGLDGATFDVLDPMMAAGRMPNLKAFVDRGTSGVLESTKPPITPAAWTTFMTGKTPGSHGILDFERYDSFSHRLVFNSTQSVSHVRTLWQMVGDKGLRVGAVNVPMTYPPRPVNGFLITGFETPGVDTEFTYPAKLKGEILERWPGYTFKTNWRRKSFGGDALFAENLRRFCDSFHEGADVTRFCGDAYGWDVLMVVFKLVDNLQHKTWKYLDPRFNRGHEKRAEMVADCFNELDAAIGKLFDYADQHDATVFIMSDHGHGSLEGKSQPNHLLREWGYLHLDSSVVRAKTRAQYLIDRARRKTKGRFANQRQVTDELAVDFSRTRACVMHAGMYGFLYLNLEGRQPGGIVLSSEYDSLRDELRDRFLATRVTTPDGRSMQLFSEVHKPEALYDCDRVGREWMPDLLLAPADGLSVVRKIRGSKPVVWLPWRKIEGTHRFAGMFAAAGPGIAAGRKARAAIIDSTPTILALLGLNVPDDLEGKVITELFDKPIKIGSEPAIAVEDAGDDTGGAEVFSESEQARLTKRLADLGYLE
jgi:predicted AlkP superfamily phosphohydrolase/phosphomutase